MARVTWAEEEAVALFDLYFREGMNAPIEQIVHLSKIYRERAEDLGLVVDEKFRNVSGLKMQLACIHYVVTEGREGMSNASKLFYATFELYQNDRERYECILREFKAKYSTTKKYNKLVRDRIPEIIKASGRICVMEILSNEDYLRMVDAKLDEELAEYHKDQNIEELADLMEVIYAAAMARGYTLEQLEQVRAEKAAERGGFEKKILLREVVEP